MSTYIVQTKKRFYHWNQEKACNNQGTHGVSGQSDHNFIATQGQNGRFAGFNIYAMHQDTRGTQ